LYETTDQVPSTPPLRRSTRSLTATPKHATSLFDLSDSEHDEGTKPAIKEEGGSKTPSNRNPSSSSKKASLSKSAVKEEEDGKPPLKRSPSKKASLVVPHPPPKNWEKQYEIIREQRKRIVAPVDLMGCEQGGRNPEEPVVELSRKVRHREKF
jgi:endonuclease-3